jgi:ferritin
MIHKKMEEAINKQINAEMYSAYLYLAMAAYFEGCDQPGFASWMKVQYQEELSHALKFFNYVHERGGQVTLAAIDAPQHKWDSPLHVFEETLKHEEYVTSLINGLFDIALEVRDHTSNSFLQWFLDEQVEEEATASNIVAQMKMVSESRDGLFMLDKELGQRVFVDATQAK